MNANTGNMKKYETNMGRDVHLSPSSRTVLENRLHNFFLHRMGELMPGFLHNLGNPLSVILGNAELLSMSYEKDIVNDIISMATDIKFEIKKLQKILHTIMGTGSRYLNLRDVILTQIQILRNDLTFKHKMTLTTNINPDSPDFLVPAMPASALFALIFKNIITDFRIKSELQQLSTLNLKLNYPENEDPEITIISSDIIEFIDEQDDLMNMILEYLTCTYTLNNENNYSLILKFESLDGR